MMRISISAVALLLSSACRSSTDVVCTQELRPGILVTARDSVSGAPAGDRAIAVAIDGYLSVAQPGVRRTEGVTFAFAAERPGTYAVRVEQTGYRPWERTDVRVRAGECHVRTVRLTALLQR